jgi:hypothetical protein
MPLNTYIDMSTKNIIKLAERFYIKYADNYSEEKRIVQTIIAKFSNFIAELKRYSVSVTLVLDYDTGILAGGKIVAKEITWSAETTKEEKAYLGSFIPKILELLNTVGMNFQDGPWNVTLPPLK